MAKSINWNPDHNWRLRFHLQTPTGRIGDPNGLSQLNGVYHWFHQYAPGWPADGLGWGHWTSEDLVSWTFHGETIRPDNKLDSNGSYSGCALVKDGKLWCYYTGNVLQEGDFDYDFEGRLANEILVTSEDGNNFSEKLCVLENADYPAYCSNHVRDPYVWEQDGALHMLLGARTKDNRGAVLLYRSDNGRSWKFEGSATTRGDRGFGYMWECPNFARIDGHEYLFICPQGVPKQPFKYQNIYNCGYFPLEGKLIELMAQDPKKLEADAPYACLDADSFVETDYGFDIYCPQIFTDESGRMLSVGWVGLPDAELQYEMPTREWTNTLTLPRVLSLNSAGRPCWWPAKEIDSLHREQVSFSAQVASGATGYTGSQTNCDMFDVDGAVAARFESGTADVLLQDIQGEGRVLIGADVELLIHDDMLELDFQSPAGRWRTVRRLPLSALSAGKVHDLRIVVDTSVIEVFINGGEKTMTTRWYPLELSPLYVTSSLRARHTAWEMGAFSFTI